MPPPETARAQGLADLIVGYAGDADIPPEWLTRLKLGRPRVNLRGLDLPTRVLKRAIDVAGAAAGLLLLAPVLVLLALLLRCTSRGPAIYRQVRVGLNLRTGPPDRRHRVGRADRRQSASFGRPFTMYKLRTMVLDAERDGPRLAGVNDARITALGRFLRRTRLDEVPQLWNVLKGDMSLVGPRPERPEFMARLSEEIPGYLGRLGLKPGITGLAQVLNGYDSSLESVRRKVALDLLYLENCCLRNDVKILMRTVGVVLTGSGAR